MLIKLLEQNKASTINDTSYVLFELPLNVEPENLYNIIYEMKQNKLVPVLAHPERYTFVQQDPNLVYDLVENGVIMQANYGSIIGEYGSKAQLIVQKMLQNNLVHVLGTNSHKQNTIYPRIPQILNEIIGYIGEEKLNELTTINPKLILNNKRIDIRQPHNIELTLKEKIVMKFWKD